MSSSSLPTLQTERGVKRGSRLLHHGVLLAVLVLGAAVGLAGASMLLSLGGGEESPGAASVWLAVVPLAAAAACLYVYFHLLACWLAGAWRDLSLAPYRLVLYAVFVGWAAFVGFGLPPVPWAAVVTLSVSLGLAAVRFRFGPQATWKGRIGRIADVAMLNVCLLVPIGELGLRLVSTIRPSVLLTRPHDDALLKIAQNRYPAGLVRLGFPVNRGGHYDTEFVPKRPGEILVLSIGDSFSAGVVPHYYHFTTVAERNLPGVTVHNMGLPAIDPPEYLFLLRTEGIRLNPDLVVVNLFLGNDVGYQLPPKQAHPVLRSWLDREHLLVLQVPKRVVGLLRQGRDAGRRLEARSGEDDGRILRTVAEIEEAFPWIADPLLEEPSFDPVTFGKIEGQRMYALRELSREEIDRHLAPVLAMRRVLGETPLLVMIIPDQFQVDDVLWNEIKPAGWGRVERRRSLWFTCEWLERHEIPYLNLLPYLRRAGRLHDGDTHLYHRRNTHFNARGNHVAGRALAEFLRPRIAELEGEARPQPSP